MSSLFWKKNEQTSYIEESELYKLERGRKTSVSKLKRA